MLNGWGVIRPPSRPRPGLGRAGGQGPRPTAFGGVCMDHPGRSGLGRERFLRLSAAAGGAAVLSGLPRSATAGVPLHCAPPTPPGPATPWAGDSRAIQTRPSAYTLSAAYLTKLQNAYAAMRALPASDGRSFQAQANIHGWWCG